MKQVVILSGIIITTVVISFILLSINCKSSRKFELDEAVTVALQQTLEDTYIRESFEITTEEQMMEQFTKNLAMRIDSVSDIKIEFITVDYLNGIMDVEVEESFVYPNGKAGSVIYRRAIICD